MVCAPIRLDMIVKATAGRGSRPETSAIEDREESWDNHRVNWTSGDRDNDTSMEMDMDGSDVKSSADGSVSAEKDVCYVLFFWLWPSP
jgi:hypothetical protein